MTDKEYMFCERRMSQLYKTRMELDEKLKASSYEIQILQRTLESPNSILETEFPYSYENRNGMICVKLKENT